MCGPHFPSSHAWINKDIEYYCIVLFCCMAQSLTLHSHFSTATKNGITIELNE